MGRAKMHNSKTASIFKDRIQVFGEMKLFRKVFQSGSSICLVLVREKQPSFCLALFLETAGWHWMNFQ